MKKILLLFLFNISLNAMENHKGIDPSSPQNKLFKLTRQGRFRLAGSANLANEDKLQELAQQNDCTLYFENRKTYLNVYIQETEGTTAFLQNPEVMNLMLVLVINLHKRG